MIKKLYRYEVINYEDGPKISLDEYEVVSETPKGHWIAERFFFWSDTSTTKDKWKWVANEGNKIFARATKKAALTDLKYRRSRYRRILKARLEETELVLAMIAGMEE